MNVDMSAVARVSTRVNLLSIRLTELSLTAPRVAPPGAPLEPEFSQECTATSVEKGTIEVTCVYGFKIHSAGEEIADINAKYSISYQLNGDQPVADNDLAQFASANGAYHSWPFLRELLFGLTSRMGYPPFTLPVLSFAQPKTVPAAQKQEVPAQ